MLLMMVVACRGVWRRECSVSIEAIFGEEETCAFPVIDTKP